MFLFKFVEIFSEFAGNLEFETATMLLPFGNLGEFRNLEFEIKFRKCGSVQAHNLTCEASH